MQILGVQHEKKPYWWAEVVINELDHRWQHIPETMTKETHVKFSVAPFLRAWKDHQGIGCPHPFRLC
jgi:hypothetical protein